LELAKLCHDRCKRTEAEIARALHGNWRAEHLFALRQAVELHASPSVPEPAGIVLLSFGGAGMLGYRLGKKLA
jgi:hypothetical protein